MKKDNFCVGYFSSHEDWNNGIKGFGCGVYRVTLIGLFWSLGDDVIYVYICVQYIMELCN